MKKQLVALLAVAGLSILGATMALAGTGVVGSVHDLRKTGPAGGKWITNKDETRVCVFCHTPHHALLASMNQAQGNYPPDFLPLWSHTIDADNFIPYWSAMYAAKVPDYATGDVLTGPSRLCMSCHDGATAVDAYYNDFVAGNPSTIIGNDTPPGTAGANHFGSPAIGAGTLGEGFFKSVARSHPMGFDFQSFMNGTKTAGFVSTVLTDDYKGNAGVSVKSRLYDSLGDGTKLYMTCATCHDVHNKLNPVESGGATTYLTLSPQADSQLCTTCHDK